MKALIENIDFYYNEAGLMVFTEKYHRDRGYCCGNGCLHCPYGHERVPAGTAKSIIRTDHDVDGDAGNGDV